MLHPKNKILNEYKDTLPLIKSNSHSTHHNQNLYDSSRGNRNENNDPNNDHQNGSIALFKVSSKYLNRNGENEVKQNGEKIHQRKLEEDMGLLEKNSYFHYKKHLNLPQSPELDEPIKQKRFVKSVMELHDENPSISPSIQVGRYKCEVMTKFNEVRAENLTDEGIVKSSEQIKDQIRKYNDILTEMINKSLRDLSNKKSIKTSVEDNIKIAQQEIKNNSKIESLDHLQLKRLTEVYAKFEDQENYNAVDMQEDIRNLHLEIKDTRKRIQIIQSAVENESKKFIVNDFLSTKPEIHPQLSQLQERIIQTKKEWEKNEERKRKLEKQEKDFLIRIEEIEPKEMEAIEIIQNDQLNDYKNKKFEEKKRKLDTIKADNYRRENLFKAKSNLLMYENESYKQKLRNSDMEMSNVEVSIKQLFERTFHLLTSNTPRNEATKKITDRILEEMTAYQNDSTFNKTENLQIMQELATKRNSLDNAIKLADKKKPLNLKKNGNNPKEMKKKTKSQQSERSRIWKPEDVGNKEFYPNGSNNYATLNNSNQLLDKSSLKNDKNFILDSKDKNKLIVSQNQQVGTDEYEQDESDL